MEDHDASRALIELIEDVQILLPDALTCEARTWTRMSRVQVDEGSASVGFLYRSEHRAIRVRVTRTGEGRYDLRALIGGVALVERRDVSADGLDQLQTWIDAFQMRQRAA